MKKQIERALFAVSITATTLSFFYQNAILNIITLISALSYLSLGWYLFRPSGSRIFNPVYFIFGYSISTLFMGLLFEARDYPLSELIIYAGAGELLLSLILLLIYDKESKYRLETLLKCVCFLILATLGIILF